MPVKLRQTSVFLCMLFVACGLFGNKEAEQKAAEELERKQLEARVHLRELVAAVSGTVEDAGLMIASRASDIGVKRLSVLYRMRAIEAAQETMWRPNTAAGFIDLWTMCVQFEQYLTGGDGGKLFGDLQPIAVAASESVLRQIEVLAREYAAEERYAQVHDAVYEFAAKHRMEGSFVRLGSQPSEAAEAYQEGMFGWLPSFQDFNPFGGVSEGIGEGAQAIVGVGRVVDRFNDIVELLPRRLGWKLELMMYDLQEMQSVNDVAGGIARIGTSAEGIMGVVEALPASVRGQVEVALESIDPKLQEVRATLADVKAASGSLDTTGAQFEKTAQSLELMAAQLETTLKTFNKTYILLDGDPNAPPPEPAPDDEEAHPFNVLEFDQTARSLTTLAAQLQQTLDTFSGIIESDKLAGQIAEVSASTEETFGSLIWTGVLGAIAVIVAFFAALFGYRRLLA